jgi:hypothetical protein
MNTTKGGTWKVLDASPDFSQHFKQVFKTLRGVLRRVQKIIPVIYVLLIQLRENLVPLSDFRI